MFSSEEREHLWRTKFHLLGSLYNYTSPDQPSSSWENCHSKQHMNSVGACTTTKPCCCFHQSANWNVLEAAERTTWRVQLCGAEENWSSPLQGWGVLVSPVSILRGICFWPLCGFCSLSLIFRAPRGLSAKVSAMRCFVEWHLKKRQKLVLNNPWHGLPEYCRLIHKMRPRRNVSVTCPESATHTIIFGLQQ